MSTIEKLLDQRMPLQLIEDDLLSRHNVQLLIKREDLRHQQISGNKWHKLKHHILAAQQKGFTKLLSFGGAYSNHLHAMAAIGPLLNMDTVGVIRGGPFSDLNPTLTDNQKNGMHLHYVSREDYRCKGDVAYQQELLKLFGPAYIIPEGGGGAKGVKGCVEFGQQLVQQFFSPFGQENNTGANYIVLPVGTGTTLAGVALGAALGNDLNITVLGISVLKGAYSLEDDVKAAIAGAGIEAHSVPWKLNHSFHGGGYAKIDRSMQEFMLEWQVAHQIELDAIYTAKMMYAIYQLVLAGEIESGSRVIAIHTGGLQGNRSLR